MSQQDRVPEYILEESEKIHPTGNLQVSSDRDYLALLADLEILHAESKLAFGMLENITSSLLVLVASVREQR